MLDFSVGLQRSLAPVQVAPLQRFDAGPSGTVAPCKGLVLVPVHVLGRDLRFGPILRVPVHRLDRDALQVDTVQVALLQRFGAGPGPCFGPGPPFWADIAGPGPSGGPGPASASERARQKCQKYWKQACGSVIDSLYLLCLT